MKSLTFPRPNFWSGNKDNLVHFTGLNVIIRTGSAGHLAVIGSRNGNSLLSFVI